MTSSDQAELPLVSIIVPSWQKGSYLRQCLQSLLGQTYPRIEILVRDNLSTDGTARVLEELSPQLAAVVTERDAGQADALRRGFSECCGEILGWLNADDMLMPEAVALAVNRLTREPRVDVVYGHCVFLDEGGQFLRYFDDVVPFSRSELLNYSDFIPQPSTFFRRRVYEEVGGVDAGLTYTMDWDLWCRFARAGCKFELIPEVLSGARLYQATKTAKGGWRRMLEIGRVNARHCTTLFPMVPVLYAAHLHSTWLQPRIGRLHTPLRTFWRRLTGPRNHRKVLIHGLASPASIAGSEFRLCLPVFDSLQSIRLSIQSRLGNTASPEVEATLNGEHPVRLRSDKTGLLELEWPLAEGRQVPSVEIVGTVEGELSAPPELSLRLLRADVTETERGPETPASRPEVSSCGRVAAGRS